MLCFVKEMEKKKKGYNIRKSHRQNSDFPGAVGNNIADMDTQLPGEIKCVRSRFTSNTDGHIFVSTM